MSRDLGARHGIGPAFMTASLLFGLAGVLVGCGGSDDDQEPVVVDDSLPAQVTNPDAGDALVDDELLADVPNPCELVTEAEVADTTGQDVQSTAYQQLGPAEASCNHLFDEEGTVGTAIGVTVEQAEAALETYDDLDDTEVGTVERADGVELESRWSPTLGTLVVLDDETLLTVTLLVTVDQDPDEQRRTATELVLLALEDLPAG